MTGRDPPQRARPPAQASGADGEENRVTTNIVLLIAFLVLVGGGIWLVDAMLDARRADECISAGRRNCGQPEVAPLPAR